MANFVFIKCFVCSRNSNKNDLINMIENTVQINGDNIDFKELILDTCFVQMDETQPNYLCMDCNNNLVLFHMFKRDVKKYSDFNKYITKLEILAKLEKFLDKRDSTLFSITEDITSWSIACHEVREEEEIIEYDPGEECIDERLEEAMAEREFNCNELSEEHSLWLQDEFKNSVVKKDSRIAFKCSVCSICLRTSKSLLNHLRKIHLLKHLKAECEASDKQSAYLNKIVDSCKMEKTDAIGQHVPTWKCSLCKQLVLSEISFKIHVQEVHTKELTSECFPESSPIWQCPYGECKKDLSSQELLENHLRIHHENESFEIDNLYESLETDCELSASKKRKLNSHKDLNQEQIDWIREQTEKSKVMKGRKTLFKCSLCMVVLTTQASLSRHLRDLHILRDSKDEKSILRIEVSNSKVIINTENGKETAWKCGICENRFYKSEQAFKLHYRMTHIRSTEIDSTFIANCKTFTVKQDGVKDAWQCPECNKIFLHRDGLRHHLKSLHSNIRKIAPKPRIELDLSRLQDKLGNKNIGRGDNFCNECGVKFLTSKHHVKPKVHRECHETFKALTPFIPHYKCTLCRMIFNSQTSLDQHVSNHGNPKSAQKSIEVEGLADFGAKFYKEAVGDADDACLDEAIWKCGHCPAKYFDESNCVAHQLLLHSKSIFCCVDQMEFCGVNGLSKFTNHMKNKHPELFPEISYPCGSCNLKFSTIYEKLSHQKVCDSKRFECDFCGKRYTSKYQLQAHMLFELGITGYSCEHCNKKCKTMSDLRIHYNIHTGDRPYQCSVCDKSFKTPAARSTHMEKHTLENGLSCELCGINLANRTQYRRHQQYIHNQQFRESRFEKNQCSHCKKCFLRKSHLSQHMKLQHGV